MKAVCVVGVSDGGLDTPPELSLLVPPSHSSVLCVNIMKVWESQAFLATVLQHTELEM